MCVTLTATASNLDAPETLRDLEETVRASTQKTPALTERVHRAWLSHKSETDRRPWTAVIKDYDGQDKSKMRMALTETTPKTDTKT